MDWWTLIPRRPLQEQLGSSPVTSVTKEFQIFFNSAKLQDSDMEKRERVLLDLKRILLKADLPDCQISPFGSYLSRIGLRTSDLDITLMGMGYGKKKEMEMKRLT